MPGAWWVADVDPLPAASSDAVPTPVATTDAPTAPATQGPIPTVPATTSAPTPTPEATPEPSVATSPPPEPTPTSTPAPAATTLVPTPTSTGGTVWTTPPTVTTSELPVGVIALALLVLVAATAAIALATRRGAARRPVPAGGPAEGVVGRATATATDPRADARTVPLRVPTSTLLAGASAASDAEDDVVDLLAATVHDEAPEGPREEPASVDETVRFCLQLGEAMIDATAPVVQVQDALEHVAHANGLPDVEVVALPTALVLSTPRAEQTRTVAVSAGYRSLRLDQVHEVLEVADLAREGAVGPAEGSRRIAAAFASSSPYAAWQQALGYVISAVGLALVLGGSLTDVALAAVLGAAVVGFEKLTSAWAGPYRSIVVLLSAFGVSTAVFAASRTGLDVSLLPALVAPLITFLPGALLTTSVIDLATRQMIAGAARLAAGAMTLVLLALGIVGGANLVGIPASAVAPGGEQALGWVGAWLGVVVYGAGVTIRHSARRRAVPWILLVLVVAYAGQVVGGALLGSQVSGFVGALAMTPVALVVARHPDGPPAMVSFLPAFWLLVPGALGLVGVTSVLGESADQGITAVVTAATTMVAISLGVLTGLGAGSWALANRWWVRERAD